MSSASVVRSQVDEDLTIAIKGRFDFAKHVDFRSAYETADHAKIKRFTVDLKDVIYIDSSALGMLLLLRDYAGGDAAQVRLINSCPDVKKILDISNFSKLFDMK